MKISGISTIIIPFIIFILILTLNIVNSASMDERNMAQWPMYHYNSTYSGRSPFITLPNAGKILWKTQITSKARISGESILIDSKGNLYFYASDMYLYSMTPNGTLRWKVSIPTASFISGFVIGANDTIYIRNNLRGPPCDGSPSYTYLYIVKSNGTVFSKLKMNFTTSPVVGSKGEVYIGARDGIYKVHPKGSIEKYTDIVKSPVESISIGPEGTMYLWNDTGIYALSKDLKILWKISKGNFSVDRIVVDSDKSIYVRFTIDGLTAYNNDGSIRWHISHGGGIPAIGNHHRLYFISGETLYCVSSQSGKEIWHISNLNGNYLLSPIIGGDGTIYVGSWLQKNNTGYLYAITPEGKLRWKIKTDGGITTSPAISKNGTIYVGTTKGVLYAIGDYANETKENAANPWIYYSIGIVAAALIVSVAVSYRLRRK